MTQSSRNSCLVLPVLSGSMRPYLRAGGQIRIDCAAADRARPGDIIVFHEAGRLIAHRLLLRLRLGRRRYLYQRGDAAGIGHWVREKQVLGVVTTSTDVDGTILYVRGRHDPAARRAVSAHIFRAVLAQARSVLRTLVAIARAKR